MEYFSNYYGLVTDNDPVTENGQLFLAEYLLLQDEVVPSINRIMYEQLFNSWTGTKGLYHRNPDLTDRRIMSHDNLAGIMSWSFVNKTGHAEYIWDYLLKHGGTYDNSQGKTKQLSRFLPFNPSNFFIWGLCADSNIYLLFLPFYVLSLIISCNKKKEDTSGKILSWVEMYPHRNHWLVKYLFKYYERKMREQYGDNYIKELMKIYHGGNSREFPINKILGI